MKKILYSILIVYAAFSSSCQKVDEMMSGPSNASALKITGSIASFDETKVSYSFSEKGLKSRWEVGDEVFGFDDKDNPFSLKVSNIADGKATFSIVTAPTLGATKLYAVYYPGTHVFENGELNVDLSSQSGKLDKNTPAIMCATGEIQDGSVNLKFENQTAIVGIYKMRLTSGSSPVASGVKVTGVNLHNVASKGCIKIEKDEFKLWPDSSLEEISASGLELQTDKNGEIEVSVNDIAPYFAVIPGNSKIDVTVTTQNDAYHVGTISETELSAGKYYYIGQELDRIVATIGETGYKTLWEAFEDANKVEGDVVIKMYANTSVDSQIKSEKSNGKITLDLNGKKIESSASTALYVTHDFEVCDNALNQGSVKAQNCAVRLSAQGTSTLTISGGNFEASGYTEARTGVIYVSHETGSTATLAVSGGNIICTNKEGRAVNLKGTGSLTGGVIKSEGYGWRIFDGGTSTIDGTATIETSGSYSPIYLASGSIDFKNGYAKSADNVNIFDGSNIFITGGHFNKPVSVDSDYICIDKHSADYRYAVEKITESALFENTGEQCTLPYAFALANNYNGSCTIRLLENYQNKEERFVTNTAGVTLDLNGKTLTIKSSNRITPQGGKLIIDDSSEKSGAVTNTTHKSNVFSYSSGSLVLNNGNITQPSKGTAEGNAVAVVYANENASFEMNGGTIDNNGNSSTSLSFSSSESCNISGGEIKGGDKAAVAFSGSGELKIGTTEQQSSSTISGLQTALSATNGQIYINGGTFRSSANPTSGTAATVMIKGTSDSPVTSVKINNATVEAVSPAKNALRLAYCNCEIDGGSYSSQYYVVVAGSGSSDCVVLTIKSGYFTNPENSASVVLIQGSSSTVTIEGGNFKGGSSTTVLGGSGTYPGDAKPRFILKGGYYSKDPTRSTYAKCDEGYEVSGPQSGDYPYSVVKK